MVFSDDFLHFLKIKNKFVEFTKTILFNTLHKLSQARVYGECLLYQNLTIINGLIPLVRILFDKEQGDRWHRGREFESNKLLPKCFNFLTISTSKFPQMTLKALMI